MNNIPFPIFSSTKAAVSACQPEVALLYVWINLPPQTEGEEEKGVEVASGATRVVSPQITIKYLLLWRLLVSPGAPLRPAVESRGGQGEQTVSSSNNPWLHFIEPPRRIFLLAKEGAERDVKWVVG